MSKNVTAADFFAAYHPALATVGTKYARMRLMLEAALRDTFWGENGKVPTEHELARATGMSLGTIQRALRELVNEGRLVRTPGRGTYVVEQKYRLGKPFVNARFLGDDGVSVLPIEASFVGRQQISTVGPWTEALRPRGKKILRIERRFDVNGEFSILSRFFVDIVRFPKFSDLNAGELRSTNLRGLLARMHRFPTVTHHQTLRFYSFAPEVARVLKCRAGTMGLLQSVTASIHRDDNVYFTQLFIPPNDRELQLPDAVLNR